MEEQHPTIRPFDWGHWTSLWQLRFAQLAEHGIWLDPEEMPQGPEDVGRDDPEWDYDHMAEVYLRGAGGFWLAWWGDVPAGHVGAQDLGGVVELRRMYVRAEYRRRGIGTRLVQALIEHCASQGVQAIELWTAEEGPGRQLYRRLGFRRTGGPGPGYEQVDAATGRPPAADEIRMRLKLSP
jgi:GNAT superfamily N-acetyltransferase